jgi:hypothetical protein
MMLYGQKEQIRQWDCKAESKQLMEHHLGMDCRRESCNLNKAGKLQALDTGWGGRRRRSHWGGRWVPWRGGPGGERPHPSRPLPLPSHGYGCHSPLSHQHWDRPGTGCPLAPSRPLKCQTIDAFRQHPLQAQKAP